MFYRVVMQGRTLGGADVEEVKRQFVRVTGLPATVADGLFGGMPQVVKRQLTQADAERIAATLRAIGAAATVERELQGKEDETPEGIRVVATPLNAGPPTVIPGMEPPPVEIAPVSRQRRWLDTMREKWPLILGGLALVAGAILLEPFAADLVGRMRRSPAPAPVAAKPAPPPEVVEPVTELNANFLQGPWRCTDQRTGASTYWSYAADGALIFHGDVLKEGGAPRGAAASAPTGWKLEGRRLLHTFAQRAPDTYAVADLTLTRLRYGDERGLEIQCRRP
jgi:hypothetical protein